MVESDTPVTVDSAILVLEDTMARGLLTPRPTMVVLAMLATADLATLVMEDTMARGLLTPRPTMVVLATPDMADSAMPVMEDTMARGLLTPRPTMVDSGLCRLRWTWLHWLWRILWQEVC